MAIPSCHKSIALDCVRLEYTDGGDPAFRVRGCQRGEDRTRTPASNRLKHRCLFLTSEKIHSRGYLEHRECSNSSIDVCLLTYALMIAAYERPSQAAYRECLLSVQRQALLASALATVRRCRGHSSARFTIPLSATSESRVETC